MRLDQASLRTAVLCRICSSPSSSFAVARVLGQYDVQYYLCNECHFIQTENPYWLDDAYSEPLIRSDIGLISRNVALSKLVSLVIFTLFNRAGEFLDYGAGNGMLVRLMRDRGFDFRWYDKHADNWFAKGFEAREGDLFELLSAFEVFEHLPTPIDEVESMLKYSDSILFSTAIVPKDLPLPHEWWYYALDGGQHVSLYSGKSLSILARRLGLNFYSNGVWLHLLTRRRVSEKLFRVAGSPKVSAVLAPLTKKPSLLGADYFQITGHRLA